MAQQEHPFIRADERTSIDGDEQIEERLQEQAGQQPKKSTAKPEPLSTIEGRLQEQTDRPGIERNGYQRISGPLAPSRPGATPRKRLFLAGASRQKWLPLALGLVGLVVILTCLGVGAIAALNALSIPSSLDSPEATLDDFYSALRTGNYKSAYNDLSTHYQQQIGGETAFENRWEFLQGDPIQSYQISNLQTQSQSASATIQVVRGMQGTTSENQIQQVALIVEDNAWRIDNITTTSPSTG